MAQPWRGFGCCCKLIPDRPDSQQQSRRKLKSVPVSSSPVKGGGSVDHPRDEKELTREQGGRLGSKPLQNANAFTTQFCIELNPWLNPAAIPCRPAPGGDEDGPGGTLSL